jgi:hypothetical protein
MVKRKSIGQLSHLKTLVLSNVHHLAGVQDDPVV